MGSNNIFRIAHNNVLPKEGRMLIAEPFQQDAYFQRSVILLVEHNAQGSLGFILNKQTELTVNTFFEDLAACAKMPIYLGGPVSTNRLFFVHTLGPELIPGSKRIGDSLYFDGDFTALRQYILKGYPVQNRVRFFLGYSGWDRGQLHQEIKENAWAVANGSPLTLFEAEGDRYWKDSVGLLGKEYLLWTTYPKDPNLN